MVKVEIRLCEQGHVDRALGIQFDPETDDPIAIRRLLQALADSCYDTMAIRYSHREEFAHYRNSFVEV